MFFSTVLVYPCVLALLCVGAGLLVDRISGRFLPAPLLLTVGAAALIALSQLTTYASPLAPATPYIMLAFALAAASFAAVPPDIAAKLDALRHCPILMQYHHQEVAYVKKKKVIVVISELVEGKKLHGA